MLRRPDFDPPPQEDSPYNLRALLVAATLLPVVLAASWLSPLGALFGLLASIVTILFGLFVGWFVTYVIKLPRDGRGVHERSMPEDDEFREEDSTPNFH